MQRGCSDEAARLRRMPHRGPNVHGLVDRRDLPRMRRHSERVLGGRFRKCLRPYGVRAVDDPVVLPRRRMRGRGQRLVLVQALTRRECVRSFTTTAIDEPDTRLPARGTSEISLVSYMSLAPWLAPKKKPGRKSHLRSSSLQSSRVATSTAMASHVIAAAQ